MSVIRASAAGGVSHFFQGLRHASESAEDTEARFLIGLTDDNKIGFVESEAPSFDISHTGVETPSLESNLVETTYGPSRPSIMDTSTRSATPTAKEDGDPDLAKTG